MQKKYLGKAFKHTMGKGAVSTYFLVTKVENHEGWASADVTYVEFYRSELGLVLRETTTNTWDDDDIFTDHTPIEVGEFLRELTSNLARLTESFNQAVWAEIP